MPDVLPTQQMLMIGQTNDIRFSHLVADSSLTMTEKAKLNPTPITSFRTTTA
jgi:hypothetical protein